MTSFRFISALFLVAVSSSEAFTTTTSRPLSVTALAATNNEIADDSRRSMFKKAGAFAAAVAFTPVVAANALDMDAFANAQVRKKHREIDRGRKKEGNSMFEYLLIHYLSKRNIVLTIMCLFRMCPICDHQIEADVKNCDPKRDPKCMPKMNADEALCKYGQSGRVKSEACKRVKAAGGDISQ